MICPNCGKMIPAAVRYCPACGANVQVTAPAGPSLFDEGEDFLAGSVPRYEDSGESFAEEPQEGRPADPPADQPDLSSSVLQTGPAFGPPDESDAEPASPAPAPAPAHGVITSMYGEQYQAEDAKYSQGAELTGLNLLHPSDSPEDAANRKTAAVVLGVFAGFCVIAAVAAAFVISSLFRGISLPHSSGIGDGGLWDFLTRRRPEYGGYSEDDGFSFDEYAPFNDDSWDSDDFWNDDSDDSGGDDDFWGSDQDEAYVPDPGITTVQTPDLVWLDWPEYNATYASPAELGNDLYGGNVRIEGDLYRFPMPLSELLGNGWEISSVNGSAAGPDTDSTVLAPTEYGYLRLEKDGHVISSLIYANEFAEDCTLPEAMVVSLQCRDTDTFTMDLADDIRIGGESDPAEIAGKYGFTSVKEGSSTSYTLSFAPTEDAAARNIVTLYDYEGDGTLDSVYLYYTAPFAPQ